MSRPRVAPGAGLTTTIDLVVRQVVRDAVAEALREHSAGEVRYQRNAGEGYLSVANAARVVDVAPGTIRAWIRAGRLEARRAGRVLRVSRGELERFMAGAPNEAQRRDTRRRAEQVLRRGARVVG